jgi:hypothetical protein
MILSLDDCIRERLHGSELEILWKEAVMAYFNAMSRNLHGGTQTTKKLNREYMYFDRVSIPAPPECKLKALLLETSCSVIMYNTILPL